MRLIKLCPSCGSEFVHTVETCVDCGATLQVADPLSVDRSATSAGPPPEDVVWLRTADPAWVRQLAGLLEEAEIPYFIELVDQGQGPFFMAAGWLYALGVRPEDEAIARKLDAYLYDQQVVGPEGADGPNLEDTNACPACGERLAPTSGACGECGLEFPGEEALSEGV